MHLVVGTNTPEFFFAYTVLFTFLYLRLFPFYSNAYEVHCDLPDRLRQWAAREAASSGSQVTGAVPVVRSLWWDLYEEEFESQTIVPNTLGADFAYLHDGAHREFLYGPALRHFGLSPSDITERAQRYERVQKEREELRVAAAAVAEARAARRSQLLWQSPPKRRARLQRCAPGASA